MRALVLAAGLGTRMRPLTNTIPKCLVPIQGHPQLAYWFALLRAHGVDEVRVNTHHLYEQVEEYIATATLPVRVELVYEPELLGSAGTLRANRDFFEGNEPFFIAYGDTLMDADLSALLALHTSSGCDATIGLFRTPTPSACGIVALDEDHVVQSFEEKPEQPKSDLAFAGVAVASPAIFDYIPDKTPCDIGRDVLERMVGRMAGMELKDAYLRDIGTPESYALAQEEAHQLKVRPA